LPKIAVFLSSTITIFILILINSVENMAKVKVEELVYALDMQFKKALENTVKKNFPDAVYDSRMLFVDFRKELARQCNSWESVPNACMQREDF
jgi:hypothetical protein